jgi:hypothetical protein
MAKMAGENSPIVTGAAVEVELPFVTVTVALPDATFQGTTALIWFDCKYSSGASMVVPPLTNFTVTPPSVVESGTVEALAGAAAKLVPKIEKSEPGAIACPGVKLAPFTTPPTVG